MQAFVRKPTNYSSQVRTADENCTHRQRCFQVAEKENVSTAFSRLDSSKPELGRNTISQSLFVFIRFW